MHTTVQENCLDTAANESNKASLLGLFSESAASQNKVLEVGKKLALFTVILDSDLGPTRI